MNEKIKNIFYKIFEFIKSIFKDFFKDFLKHIIFIVVGVGIGSGGATYIVYKSTKSNFDKRIKSNIEQYDNELKQYNNIIKELQDTKSELTRRIQIANDESKRTIQSIIDGYSKRVEKNNNDFDGTIKELERNISDLQRVKKNNGKIKSSK